MKAHLISATIIAVGLIVGSFLIGGRYTVIRGDDTMVTRLDRLTGAIWLCGGLSDEGTGIACVRMDEDGSPAKPIATKAPHQISN